MANFQLSAVFKKRNFLSRKLVRGFYLLSHTSVYRGFTLVEYILVMGIFAILAGLVTLNLANAQHDSSLPTTVDKLITDLRSQQLKAMIGDTEGSGSTNNYGIHFETNTYTLFRGSYGNGNFVINLGGQLEFSNITFSNAQILFLKGSGEVSGFTDGENTITIRDMTNTNKKSITVNRYGVVTGIN